MRIQHTREYVTVNSDFDQEGTLYPRKILMSDGRSFVIDSVKHHHRLTHENFSGDCFTIVIKGKDSHLFFERSNLSEYMGRWFVALKGNAS